MAKRQVGKCRFYADIPSYLKIIGKYGGSGGYKWSSSGTELLDNAENVWNMNPSQPTDYTIEQSNNIVLAGFKFWLGDAGVAVDPDYDQNDLTGLDIAQDELRELIMNVPSGSSSGLYAGILGHNFFKEDSSNDVIDQDLNGVPVPSISILGKETDISTTVTQITTEEIDGETEIKNWESGFPVHNGYSLFKINGFSHTPVDIYNISFEFGGIGADTDFSIGAFTYGRWFEPEHAFDIKATIDHSYDGVKLQNTIGGSTLSNISYLGQNNWVNNLPAWTLEKQLGHDYNIGANKARRSWRVGLSYLTDDNLFDKAGNENKFFTWNDPDTSEEGTPEYVFDSSLSSFFKLTLMGKLPFIFCPDSSADDLEFALCRITNKPSFKQVANNLFSTSLVITETY